MTSPAYAPQIAHQRAVDRPAVRTSLLTHASAAADNEIGDGGHVCRYRDLARRFSLIEARFSDAGIDPEACVALRCTNTLAAALTLLYLLETGRSCLLLPTATDRDLAADAAALPSFCRYVLEALGGESAADFSVRAAERPGRQGSDSVPVGQLYVRTSGSTGQPKIAVHSHHGLLENAANVVSRLGLGSADRVSVPVPIYHMYGLGAALLPSVLAGATVDLQPQSNAIRFLAREAVCDPTVAFLTPGFCQALLKIRKAQRRYRLTVVAGDHLPEPAFQAYEQRYGTVVNLYGSTELGVIATGDPADSAAIRGSTVGRPMDGVAVCPGDAPATPRELSFRHSCAFLGYADAAGLPIAPSGSPEPGCIATRDLGEVLSDGTVRVLGRLDHLVKRDGVLVSFSSVEQAVRQIAAIEQVAVIAGEPTARGRALIAFCVATAEGEMEPRSLRRACAQRLPHHAIPDRFVYCSSLPTLATGKVDRQQLAERYRADDAK